MLHRGVLPEVLEERKPPWMRYGPWSTRSGRRIVVAGARIEEPKQDSYMND